MRQLNRIPQNRWKPDKASSIPLYTQIIRYICERITSGDWKIGMRLPSQRELAKTFLVNRSTIVTAMNMLISDGLLDTAHGAGTYVSSNPWSLLIHRSVNWSHYVSTGSFRENLPSVQAINRYEATPGILRLGTGELSPDLFPRNYFQTAIEKVSRSVSSLGYAEPLGLLSLRKTLSSLLAKQDISASPSNILVTSGSLQALQLISVSILRAGATVFTESPSYLKSLQLFQSAGLHLKGIPLDKDGLEYWRISSSFFDFHRQTLLYTIPTNHNPTGITMSERRRHELIEFCNHLQLPIIEDDAYGSLYFEPNPPKPLKALDKNDAIIYLGTTSKSLAAGLRVGWLVAPEAIVQRLGDVKMQMDYGASSLSQLILTEIIESGNYTTYTKQLQQKLLQRRNMALTVLNEYFSDLGTWNIPKGGFYIWVTLRKRIPMEILFCKAIKKGILLNPGDMYDFNPNHSLRISYAYLNKQEFTKGIQELAILIRSLSKNSSS